MSNDTFEKLYKQFKPMVIKLVNKWSKIGLIEKDDLMQIAMISLIYSYNHYDPNKGASFAGYIYSNIEFAIKKELSHIKHQDRDCKSLQTPLFDAEGKEITLEDTLVDDNVDIEAEIEDKLMIQTYKDEIEKYLDDDKSNICILRWIENCSYEFICNNLGVTNSKISSILMTSRMRLITHSKLFNEEFKKIHGISEYRTESAAIM